MFKSVKLFKSAVWNVLKDVRRALFYSASVSREIWMNEHDDVIKWKHIPRYWPFVRRIHRSFPSQRPVTRSFDVFFDLRLNKRLSKQSWGWWFEASSRPLWRHFNEIYMLAYSPWLNFVLPYVQSIAIPRRLLYVWMAPQWLLFDVIYYSPIDTGLV